MDWNNIKELIEKYDEGNTSLSEEAQLTDAFRRDDVPTELESYQVIFGYLAASQAVKAKTLTLQSIKEAPRPAKMLPLWLKQSAAAAAILGLTAATFFMVSQPKDQVYAEINNQKIYDQEVAYDETMKALLMVSEKMKTSKSSLSYLKYLSENEQSK